MSARVLVLECFRARIVLYVLCGIEQPRHSKIVWTTTYCCKRYELLCGRHLFFLCLLCAAATAATGSCRTPSFKLSSLLLCGSRQLCTANLCGPLLTYYAGVDIAYVPAGAVTNHSSVSHHPSSSQALDFDLNVRRALRDTLPDRTQCPVLL